jgi:hypothetical protein
MAGGGDGFQGVHAHRAPGRGSGKRPQKICVALQPVGCGEKHLRHQTQPESFFEQMGAFKQQTLLVLTTCGVVQCPEALNQGVATTGDRLNRHLKRFAMTHLKRFVDVNCLVAEVYATHRGNVPTKAFGREVFNQFSYDDILNFCFVKAIGSQAFNKFAKFLSNDLRRVVDG